MFGLGKRRSKADAAIAVKDEAITFASNGWKYFCETLPFRDEVGLAERIGLFSVPCGEGLRKNFQALRAAPDGLLLLFIALGVEQSGSHTREQIEEALGLKLPS